MIRTGAPAVDGWAKEIGFTVLSCSGNLALREMYETLRDDSSAKVILVDRTRQMALLVLLFAPVGLRQLVPDVDQHEIRRREARCQIGSGN